MTHNLFPQSLKTVGTLLLLSAGLPSRHLLEQQNHVCVNNKAMSVSATAPCLCQQQTICVSNKAMYVSATELCLCQQQSYVCISNKTMWQQQTSVCVLQQTYVCISNSQTEETTSNECGACHLPVLVVDNQVVQLLHHFGGAWWVGGGLFHRRATPLLLGLGGIILGLISVLALRPLLLGLGDFLHLVQSAVLYSLVR